MMTQVYILNYLYNRRQQIKKYISNSLLKMVKRLW